MSQPVSSRDLPVNARKACFQNGQVTVMTLQAMKSASSQVNEARTGQRG